MPTLRRAATTTAALSTAALALTLLPSTPAQAAVAVPTDCYNAVEGFTNAGQLRVRAFRSKTLTTYAYNPGRLPFVPRDTAYLGAAGDDHSSFSTRLALNGKYLRHVRNDLTGTRSKLTFTTLGSSWRGIRRITTGSNGYVYGLTANGLARYRLTYPSNTPRIATAGVVGTSGWGSIKTLTLERTVNLTATRKADVLLATTSGGALYEYTIPWSSPGAWKRTTLRVKGFGNFVSMNTQSCESRGRTYIGVLGNGNAYMYYDTNGNDGSGSNLASAGKVGSLWSEHTYSR